jgi:hypothetical protein
MKTQARIMGIVARLAEKQALIRPDQSLFESGLADSSTLGDLVSALEVNLPSKFRLLISRRANPIPLLASDLPES